jgi:preprotein translocase subunit SecD
VAPPPGTLRVGRYFLALLALMAVLYALVFLPGERHSPKLGLDLVGGTQVIFQAKTPNGSAPSSSSMKQAQLIMEQRVNSTGVTEATVVIQGSDQLVVSIPGGTKTDVAALGAAAKLNFRGVIAPAQPITCAQTAPASGSSSSASATTSSSASATASAAPSPTTSSSQSQAPNDAGHRPLNAAPSGTSTASSSAKASGSGSATGSAAASGSPTPSATAPPKCLADPFSVLQQADKTLKIPLSDTAYNALTQTQQQEIQAGLQNFDCNAAQNEPDLDNNYYIACDGPKNPALGQVAAYLLGPVIVPGSQISSATAQAPNPAAGQTEWSVQLTLKSSGSDKWAKYTAAHNIGSTTATGTNVGACSASTYPCADFVGFTLDGRVISAPVNESAINGRPTSITGNFTQTTASDLARQLRFGALPLTFEAQQAQTVSATLGTSQLRSGLLAGGIGLALVILYSMIYYRALGLVTIASLMVSGGLTYAMLVLLGTQIGFTLSLAGIAGFIVAIGITADSFVVFFERIKDEVHDGRSMRVAVPRAWVRARRTILSADTVSFLAAATLYYFAAGDVKGFAFTLGLSTIIDLVVVFLFTHPVVSVLSRSRTFGSARFSGLDQVRSAGYVMPDEAAPAKRAGSRRRNAPAERSSSVAVVEPDEELETTDAPDPVDDPGRPRKRTTPASGTAAERAAARRAKLREQADGTSDDGKGER